MLLGKAVVADALEHERWALARVEGALEGLDHGKRVLAPEDAVVVEHEQEEEALGQIERRSGQWLERRDLDGGVTFTTGTGETAESAAAT